MNDEIELIADHDGIAVIGDPTAVDLFLSSADLPSRDLELHRLKSVLKSGSAATQTASEVAANSGRWVKLTEKSAKALKHGDLMKGSGDNVGRAVVMKNGKTSHILEIVKTPGTALTNPAVLSGAAGLMTQVAMQQTMDEIVDYLASIDKKVDDVLRAQKDSVLADMAGVDFVIQEAMTIRQQVGRVSDVTWSKVQTTTLTIATTQAYALRQLDALASNLERDADDIADSAKRAEAKVQEWLAVLAKCFQLQDAVAVLELDRVLDTAPDELDRHRLALCTARQNRTNLIVESAEQLMTRMDAAAGIATTNGKVLLHPRTSRSIVTSSNAVALSVRDLYDRLSVDRSRDQMEARRWTEAAADVRSHALEKGADGVRSVKRIGANGKDRAKVVGGDLRGRVSLTRTRRDEAIDPNGQ